MSLRFLVVDGNIRSERDQLKSDFGATPGEHYGDVLMECVGSGANGKASYDIVCPADPDAAIPHNAAISDYDGVVLTGSSLHLWADDPESRRQVDFAREVFRAKVPFFGSCWGLQIAAVAAGGAVHHNPRGREMGYARKIMLNEAGRTHKMLAGRPAVFDAPCAHLDEVATLPPDSTLLASNAISQVQAAEFRFEGGTFWGVQYHPEFSHALTAHLIEKRGAPLFKEGFFSTPAQHAAYVADLRALDASETPKHVAFRHGLGPDVTDPVLRTTELRNFIETWAKPHHEKRSA